MTGVEQRGGQPQPQQPRQPEQDRAEGRGSLHGPTTVEGSKQLKPSHERGQTSPKLPSHEQQIGNLDSEVETMIRAYAESEADGDPKKAERLLKRYMKDSSLREFFKNLKLHGAPTLTRGGHLDFSNLEKKPEKEG